MTWLGELRNCLVPDTTKRFFTRNLSVMAYGVNEEVSFKQMRENSEATLNLSSG